MVVETALPDRHGTASHFGANGIEVTVGLEARGVVRVHAGRVVADVGVPLGQCPAATCGVEGFSDAHERGGAAASGPLDDLVAVGVERLVLQMAMGVDQAVAQGAASCSTSTRGKMGRACRVRATTALP